MRACDVLYTKPGGLSSTEALVCHTPLVHTAPIPGCESDNFKFFGEQGLALPAKHVKDQIRKGRTLTESAESRKKMQENQQKNAKPDASLQIVRLLERIAHTVDHTPAAVK